MTRTRTRTGTGPIPASGYPDPRQCLITVSFARKKGTVTYSHRPHTRTETRTEIAHWVAESLRPFKIVRDRGFQCLMKTGRPGYYIPSPSTVGRDVKAVFARTRTRIAKMLQVCAFLSCTYMQSAEWLTTRLTGL